MGGVYTHPSYTYGDTAVSGGYDDGTALWTGASYYPDMPTDGQLIYTQTVHIKYFSMLIFVISST